MVFGLAGARSVRDVTCLNRGLHRLRGLVVCGTASRLLSESGFTKLGDGRGY